MANPEALELWQIMKRDPANKICIECGASDPQWASVTLGSLFCLECSGIHRSLGVHISFVRSCTMDKWSEQQLSMMRAGGNAKCKQFFQKHGVSNDLKITERYSTGVAKAYKDMIKAQAEGRDYDEPRVGSLSTVPEVATRSISSNSLSSSSNPGNKYTGMGTPLNNQQKQSNSEWSDMFQTGFSALSSFAIATASSTTQLAKTAAEKISETQITQKVKETDWSAKVNELSTTIADKSVSGWSSFSSFISSVKSDFLGDENDKNPQSDSQQNNNNNNNNNAQRNFGDFDEQPRPSSNPKLQPTNNNSKSNHSDNEEWGDWEDKFESQWDDNMDAEPVVNKSSSNSKIQSDNKEVKKDGWDDDDDVDGWEDWDPKKK